MKLTQGKARVQGRLAGALFRAYTEACGKDDQEARVFSASLTGPHARPAGPAVRGFVVWYQKSAAQTTK